MLRYDRQIKPGLVALYDIRPGNGAGLFLLTTPEPARGDNKCLFMFITSANEVVGRITHNVVDKFD